MVDQPPRTPPPRPTSQTDGRRISETRSPQTGTWVIFLILGAIVLGVVAFSFGPRDNGATDTGTPQPAATETAPVQTAPDAGLVDPTTPAPDAVDPVTPVPGTDGTTAPAPGGTTQP